MIKTKEHGLIAENLLNIEVVNDNFESNPSKSLQELSRFLTTRHSDSVANKKDGREEALRDASIVKTNASLILGAWHIRNSDSNINRSQGLVRVLKNNKNKANSKIISAGYNIMAKPYKID